jgi:hypothetical protein
LGWFPFAEHPELRMVSVPSSAADDFPLSSAIESSCHRPLWYGGDGISHEFEWGFQIGPIHKIRASLDSVGSTRPTLPGSADVDARLSWMWVQIPVFKMSPNHSKWSNKPINCRVFSSLAKIDARLWIVWIGVELARILLSSEWNGYSQLTGQAFFGIKWVWTPNERLSNRGDCRHLQENSSVIVVGIVI